MNNGKTIDNLRNTPVNLDNDSKGDEANAPAVGKKFDFANGMQLHTWVKGAYYRDISLQAESRLQRSLDADFYDDKQFTEDEKEEYEADGRMPPLQYNIIKQTINWILGSYLRQTYDWNVLPRTEDDVEPAIRKTKLCKYIADINSSARQQYLAFQDAVKTGEGWIETALEVNDEGEQQIVVRHEHWRNMIVDSSCRRVDASDATRLFRTKILDVEQVVARFPQYENELRNESQDREQVENDFMYEQYQQSGLGAGGSMFMSKAMPYDGTREAIRVMECWYKRPMRVQILRGQGRLSGYVYDPKNPEHVQAVQMGELELVKTHRQQVCVCVFTDNTLLFSGVSPYRHNRFPFVRTVAYLDDKTGMPYGVIRALRDPQMSFNIRRNKAIYLLSTKRVVMDKGAVDDIKLLEEEVSRPDSIIQVNPNKKLEIIESPSLADAHVQFGREDESYMLKASGVTGENLGQQTNATSGIAIQARQEQGTVTTLMLYENAAWAFEKQGQLVLSLIEQFISQEMQFRITSDTKNKEFVAVNDGTDETDITKSQADFIVTKQNYHATMRQALAEQLLPLASTIAQATGNPQSAFAVIETAIGLTDIPNKDGIMAKLRESMGLPDPDETPEEKAAREQSQADQQAKQNAMLERKANAEIAKLEAEAQQAQASANSEQITALSDKMNALQDVMNATKAMLTKPHMAKAADEIIRQADDILNLQSNQPQPPQQMPVQQQVDPAFSGDMQQ